ncbi:nitroreductase family protein [Thermoactinomyces sp. DSM 45892]|uniref:nitroreductase family protein n=1 Tax=Thermoactinomyces sp. DSM 45892 TaxID=1882753 RepID=UPI00089B3F6A|nr:nitroreductase family protein [Thermoactinomyces sp. DSM 45892]SDY58389.1 Nitroreductase [Thermoactinomyces sp. DSM 45892]
MNTNFQAVKEVMLSRGSVKRYDTYEMPKEELDELLTLASSAPSAWNLQHWRYLAIQSEEAKQRLLPIAYNQIQVTESSVVIAILGDTEANKAARLVFGEALEQGELTQEIYDRTIGQIDGAYQNHQFARDAAFSNASLSAMQLMLAAKAKGFDTCAMGGFNKEALIKQFNIPDRYVPVMLITIGKAAQPARPTGRLNLDTVLLETL